MKPGKFNLISKGKIWGWILGILGVLILFSGQISSIVMGIGIIVVGVFIVLGWEVFGPTNLRFKRQRWGWGVALFSFVGVMTGLGMVIESPETALPLAVSYAVLLAFGLLLAFMKVDATKVAAREKKKADELESEIRRLLAQLEGATGARAVIAFNNLSNFLTKKKFPNKEEYLADLLAGIGFEKSRVDSKYLGTLASAAGGWKPVSIEIYEDWVIQGQNGHDFDVSTRGEVTVDGSISYDSKNNKIDNRVATLQLATKDWSQAYLILPDSAGEARRILNQLLATIEDKKPKGASMEDIHVVMERLYAESGQSPAAKLEELSNLRYQRLLSDQEFELAKAKILGI